MKTIKLTLFFVLSNCQIIFCQNQKNKKEFYNEKFNWTIKVSEHFTQLDSLFALSWLGDEDIPIHKIFALGIENVAILEASHTEVPFEILYDEQEEIQVVSDEFYQSIINELPDISKLKIDTSYTTEWIDYLEFQKFEMNILIPNLFELNAHILLKQFGDQALSIFYIANNERVEFWIETSIRNSEFEYPFSKNDTINNYPKTIEFQVEIPERYKYPNMEFEYGHHINLANPEEEISNLINPDEIILSDTTALLLIDYPGVKEWYFDISSKNETGFSKKELIEIVCQKYHQFFDDARNSLNSYDMWGLFFTRRYDGKIVIMPEIDS